MSIPTPHIAAKYGDFAKTVLMPGDPKRSRRVAEGFLTDPVLVNDTRGVQGYTGYYKGVRVSVMASGMGVPSIGIYSWELYKEYGVENIIRVGSAGALQDDIHVRDVVLAMGACTDSNFGHHFGLSGAFAPIADYTMLRTAVDTAEAMGLHVRVGNLLSSDNFYTDRQDSNDPWRRMGVLAVEMEAAGLYLNAARLHKRALAICTVSDHIYLPENLSAEERQNTFVDMITLALETAVKMENL